jgi:hypothetical protein
MSCRFSWLAVAFALAVVGAGAREAQAIALPAGSVRTVAHAAFPMPGMPAGVRIEQYAFPRIDRRGRVAFKARLLDGFGGVNNSNHAAIWAETDIGNLKLAARSGGPVTGTNFAFHDVEPGENVQMSGNGAVYFISGMSPIGSPTTFNSGVFQFTRRDGLEIVATSSPTGIPGVPATNGQSITNFLDFNERGDVTVTSSLGLDHLRTVEGALIPLPGVGPMVNDAREVAMLTDDFLNTRLLVRSSSGVLRTLAAEGGVAPGTMGLTFRTRGLGPYDNATGATVFNGRLIGPGVSDDNDYGIWVEPRPGEPVELLMREGEQAPGVDAGLVWSDFHQFSNPISLGRGGGIAMRLGLSGPGVTEDNKWGVWAGTVDKGFHLAARAGDPAPGTEPGTVFDFFSQAGVTRDGRAVFFAFLTGPSMNPNFDRGIWAEGADGLLHLIARRGDTIRLPDGRNVALSSVEFDPYFGVSELGDVAFLSTTGLGPGVFVSGLTAVPEPGAIAITLAISAIGCRSARRRRR